MQSTMKDVLILGLAVLSGCVARVDGPESAGDEDGAKADHVDGHDYSGTRPVTSTVHLVMTEAQAPNQLRVAFTNDQSVFRSELWHWPAVDALSRESETDVGLGVSQDVKVEWFKNEEPGTYSVRCGTLLPSADSIGVFLVADVFSHVGYQCGTTDPRVALSVTVDFNGWNANDLLADRYQENGDDFDQAQT